MTSLPVLQQNRIMPTPDCFGHLWDAKAPECAGGVDLMYTNKQSGSHIRERCRFFDSCGSKVQATRAAAMKATVPSQSWTFPRPQSSAEASRAQVPQMSQPMAPQQQQPQQQMVPHGLWYPAPTYQFNHGIPNYLTTPEPRAPGESIWMSLVRELLRGVIKSFGHTVAYFVDTTPVKRLPPPGGQ
jgi:hypothetical protein